MGKIEIEKFEKEYNIKVLPVKIIGNRRWAFNGIDVVKIPVGELKRIQVSDESGFIIYNWQNLNSEQRIEIVKLLNESND